VEHSKAVLQIGVQLGLQPYIILLYSYSSFFANSKFAEVIKSGMQCRVYRLK